MNGIERECIKKAVIAWKNKGIGVTVMVSAMDFGSK